MNIILILATAAVALYGSYWAGGREARAQCEARIQASIEQARATDAAMGENLAAIAEQQVRENAQLTERLTQEERRYAETIRNRPECRLDDADARGLSDPVPDAKPQRP